MQSKYFLLVCFIASLILAGCSTTPSRSGYPYGKSRGGKTSSGLPRAGSGQGGYYQDDGPMDHTPENLQNTPDAVPRVEPYAKGANKPYTVFGKRYVPFTDNRTYKARGRGSWYGKKFHGNKTSNGEIYDMFKMTAAHTTLPLPSYARVTNLDNGRQVIVRVNDRGPFHSDRIIDLSYTAALKLDYLHKGSTLLEVERLLPDEIRRINAGQSAAITSFPKEEPIPDKAKTTSVVAPVTSSKTASSSVEEDPIFKIAKASQNESKEPLKMVREESRESPQEKKEQSEKKDLDINDMLVAGSFYIQLGAYHQASYAKEAQAKYALEWAHVISDIKMVKAGEYYRLYAGPYETREAAEHVSQKIDSAQFHPLIISR